MSPSVCADRHWNGATAASRLRWKTPAPAPTEATKAALAASPNHVARPASALFWDNGRFPPRNGAAMTQKTILNDSHRALGAKMVDFGGWDMPIHYRSEERRVGKGGVSPGRSRGWP